VLFTDKWYRDIRLETPPRPPGSDAGPFEPKAVQSDGGGVCVEVAVIVGVSVSVGLKVTVELKVTVAV
jgi:hypothetical protein